MAEDSGCFCDHPPLNKLVLLEESAPYYAYQVCPERLRVYANHSRLSSQKSVARDVNIAFSHHAQILFHCIFALEHAWANIMSVFEIFWRGSTPSSEILEATFGQLEYSNVTLLTPPPCKKK